MSSPSPPADLVSGAVRVTVPATSANLGPGFDALGLALDLHDVVDAEVTSGGLTIDVTGKAADDVPRDEKHLVVRAMRAAFDALGVAPAGLRVQCVNAIPHGRGLGSSAAAIIAGVLAARALAGKADPRDYTEDLALATELEGHPDNVAPCLLGGLTIAWTADDHVRAARVDVHPDIQPVICVPESVVPTELARGLLPATVPHADAARSAGRAALLIEALTRRPDLLMDATEDWLHQRYRAAAMPESLGLVTMLRERRLPAVVSGAGPSVLVLATSGQAAAFPSPTREMAGWDVRPLHVDTRGARVAIKP